MGVEELGDNGVILAVEYWVDDPQWNLFTVRSAFARTVKRRFEREDIDVSPASQHDLEGRIRVEDAV